MLSKEDNELYTRVGPGTAMGELFRRFWLPAMLTSDLPECDGPPVRIRLLCEDLVAFRDTTGKVGVVEERCPHRQASLFFGRNEECGLRCVYHGWKFDTDGRCVDMPNEPRSSHYRDRIRLRSYPVQEAADLIWVYMGPSHLEPELPKFEWMQVPSDQRIVARWISEANWAQGMEGEIDASHLSFLHRTLDGAPEDIQNPSPGLKLVRESGVGNPEVSVQETEYGYTVCRSSESGGWERLLEDRALAACRASASSLRHRSSGAVPSCRSTTRTPGPSTTRGWTARSRRQSVTRQCPGPDSPRLIPGTAMPLANSSNDYLIDRQLQRTGNFTGIWGVSDQDRAVTESMGRIVDRTKEHLGRADRGVLTARRILIRAARDLQNGIEPKMPANGNLYAVLPDLNIEVEGNLDRFIERHRDDLVASFV